MKAEVTYIEYMTRHKCSKIIHAGCLEALEAKLTHLVRNGHEIIDISVTGKIRRVDGTIVELDKENNGGFNIE